ncbi:MAG: RluA family pseudouridine synthase [Clostridia bacterium]|nr:RluA family pseudouridine synthase [Clostridia bacterium]
MKPKILYKDADLLIAMKSAGVPSQPDTTGQEDLLTMLQADYPSAGLIHRLDTPTGGVMVFGLTPKATARLCALVQDHEKFCKEYLAVVSSALPEAEGRFTDFLFHDRQKNKAYVTDGKRKGSKEAVSDYRVLSSLSDGHTLVLVRLHTGRTHQIRVQLASRGLPLVGDGKYGSRDKSPFIGLWAYRLAFPHPITGMEVSVSAHPDAEMLPWSLFSDQFPSD